ncbi:MAG: hypothetical protein H0X47_08845 [Nitrospirales bacterium]|nr:hypothetical protein [Nitrospirales bacterium]
MILAYYGSRLGQGFSLGHLDRVVRIAGFIDKPGFLPSLEAEPEGFSIAN